MVDVFMKLLSRFFTINTFPMIHCIIQFLLGLLTDTQEPNTPGEPDHQNCELEPLLTHKGFSFRLNLL